RGAVREAPLGAYAGRAEHPEAPGEHPLVGPQGGTTGPAVSAAAGGGPRRPLHAAPARGGHPPAEAGPPELGGGAPGPPAAPGQQPGSLA
ncbi:conserved hypothetical protein, partial [Ixodes scapularis]